MVLFALLLACAGTHFSVTRAQQQTPTKPAGNKKVQTTEKLDKNQKNYTKKKYSINFIL